MSKFEKGHTPWNKGKKHTKEARLKMSKALKGKRAWNKGISSGFALHLENIYKGEVWNKGVSMKEETKRKLRENALGKTFNTGRTHFKKGLVPWNYKGGITEANQLLKGSLDYRRWRISVFKRDGWSCILCGYRSKKRGDIQADHIKPFALFPELRLDITNGRTLCISCHKNTKSYKNNHIKREDFLWA